VPQVWDENLKTIKGDRTKWSKTGRGILFEVKTYPNDPGRVNIAIVLGPGDHNMRSKVYNAAAAQPKLFHGLARPMGVQWATIFSRNLQTSAQAKNLTFEAQSANLELAWSDFQAQNLTPLINAVLAIDKELTEEVPLSP
jgi:hypothetical protein